MSESIWLEQIEAIALHASRWINFSLACGWIAFGLSMVALLYLIVRWKHGKD